MKQIIILGMVAILFLGVLVQPGLGYEGEGEGGVDPCEVCEHYLIPWACRLCELELWWEQGGCFPGSPFCY